MNYEQLFRAVFFMFSWAKIKFKKKIHCRVRNQKLLHTKVKKNLKKFGRIFLSKKLVFFRASCFGYRVKGVCPLLLPLVSLGKAIFGHFC